MSGSAVAIKEMRASFDRGLDPLVNEEYCQQNIHAVAGVLKLYFRELPTPLFPYDCYDQLMGIVRKCSIGYMVLFSSVDVLCAESAAFSDMPRFIWRSQNTRHGFA